MTTQLAPHRTDLPPPPASELSDADRVVGWVGEDTIGFRGFANEIEAMSAAWMAHRTLARRLAHRDGTRPIPIDVEPLTLARHGQRDAILAGGRPIGTLVRPGEDSRSGPDSFGFEIPVPAPRDPVRMHAKAFLLYRTLRRSGIRWALWRGDDRGDAWQRAGGVSDAAHAADTPPAAHDGAHAGAPHRAGRTPGPSGRGSSTGPGVGRRWLTGVSVALVVGALAILLRPLFSTTLVVSILGGLAALVALAALAAIVRLVVTDVWSGVRQALTRRPQRRPGRATRRPDGPATFAAPWGRQLAAYHATRRGR